MTFDNIWDILAITLGSFVVGVMLYLGCLLGVWILSFIMKLL